MVFAFLKWWYAQGWPQTWRNLPGSVGKVQRNFSVWLLLRTLFSPWKQIISTGGPSLREKFDAVIDNLLSRTIGMAIRSFIIFGGLVSMAVAAVWGLALAIAWPLLPPAVIFLIYKGIGG